MVEKHENEHPRTTPSQAPGEAGDEEARKEAEEAIIPGGARDAEADDALTPGPKAQPPAHQRRQGHKDKSEKPDGA
ncbi:hypothetical protein [Streptomyces sp. NPDC097619]|uniref:hypothetical protein n=1 Tax=Streptomyces sp. NPDC097619 TaxID=3157228 RepID=UPI00331F75C5